MDKLPPSVLNMPARGQNLHGNSLGEVLDGSETLAVLLRHFG
jgi:hypothetical protein